MKFARKSVVWLIKFYRNYLSAYKLPTCKFWPSCSEYAQDAIGKYGVFRGVFYAAHRIFRCNWFSKGGVDPLT